MPNTKSEPALILSILIAALAALAAAGGLFSKSLYRDNAFVAAAWRGNDVVTALVAVPVLAAALLLAGRGSLRWRLIWLGMLDYTLYNFAFYLFGAAFNRFFLLYVALFTFSLLALLFGLSNLDINQIGRASRTGTTERWVGGYMLFVAAGLGSVHFLQALQFITAGELPPVVVSTQHPTNVVAALDLSLMVPFFVVGGLWLWRRRPWGYVLGVMLNTKGAVYPLALAAASLSAARAGMTGAAAEIPLWLLLAAASLIASALLLRGMQSPGVSG